MKYLLLTVTFFLFVGCGETTPQESSTSNDTTKEQKPETPQFSPTPHQFQAVWDEVTSDPETTLPQERVTFAKLFDGFHDLISDNAERTLNEHADIIEHFDKLAHPNGVCMKGLWQIDTPTPYGGYFRLGSEALIIARASTALSETKRGETRAFGMAGKLFGTTDPQELQDANSANFFVIDDLSGTDAEYYTDVALTNEPDVSFNSSLFTAFLYGAKVASAFSNADKNSGIRQLYEISYLGEENQSDIITPKWMKIEAQDNQTKIGVDDFRDEFTLDKDEVLIFTISVASEKVDTLRQWEQIGTITFDTSVVSNTCDHRLHFHHPKWRDDIVYE